MPLPTSERGPAVSEGEAGVVSNFGQGYRPDLFCPEIKAREALQFAEFWQQAGELDERYRNEIPYWCIVWPGSRMLARAALDGVLPPGNQKSQQGRTDFRVLEVGCGSGLAAVAFALQGARVIATDHDSQALNVASAMASRNGASIETRRLDLFDSVDPLDQMQPDLLILGDLFYEARVAEQARRWCLEAGKRGIQLLVADPARTYGPHKEPDRWGLQILKEAQVPVHRSVENVRSRRTILLGSGRAICS